MMMYTVHFKNNFLMHTVHLLRAPLDSKTLIDVGYKESYS